MFKGIAMAREPVDQMLEHILACVADAVQRFDAFLA
jgi:hypothetical protein